MDILKHIQLVDSKPSPSRNETMKTATTWQVSIHLPLRTLQFVTKKPGIDVFAAQAKAKIMGVDRVEFEADGEVSITLKGGRVKRAQHSNETREAFGMLIARDFDLLIHGIMTG